MAQEPVVVRKSPIVQTKERKIEIFNERLKNCQISLKRWREKQSQEYVNAVISKQQEIINGAQETINTALAEQTQAETELKTLEQRERFILKQLAELKHQSKIDQFMRLIEEINGIKAGSPEAQALVERFMQEN